MKNLFITILVVLSSVSVNASNFCLNSKTTNLAYSKLLKKINILQNDLANNKIMASKADKLLLSLIKQKSPMIINWIKRRKMDPAKDDLKIASEWRKYFFKNFILRVYPLRERPVDNLIEKFFSDINKLVFTPQKKNELTQIFKTAKKLSISKIKSYSLSPQSKNRLISKIKKIKLYWMKQLPGSKYEKHPMEFIDWGIAYDPHKNEINMGIKASQYPNKQTLVAVFAHEMGHSFDPCRWKLNNPFTNVIKCLRSKKSVQALPRDDSLMTLMIKKGKLSPSIVQELKNNLTCNKSNYPPIGYQKDQINESFADWFSAEVISTYPKLDKHLRIDLCKKNILMKGSSYPTNINRLNKIYLAHPIIRKTLHLPPLNSYCPLK